MEAFNHRWSSLFREDSEASERDRFDVLLDEVDSFADCQHGHECDSAPGMSSAYVTYYTESRVTIARAICHFQGRVGPVDPMSRPLR